MVTARNTQLHDHSKTTGAPGAPAPARAIAGTPGVGHTPEPFGDTATPHHRHEHKLAKAAIAMKRQLDTATTALRTGCVTSARDAAGGLPEATATFESLAKHQSAETLSPRTQAIMKTVQTALLRYGALVDGVRAAAQTLAQDAQREQRKRAGGGLYSPMGASPTTAAAGRILDKL